MIKPLLVTGCDKSRAVLRVSHAARFLIVGAKELGEFMTVRRAFHEAPLASSFSLVTQKLRRDPVALRSVLPTARHPACTGADSVEKPFQDHSARTNPETRAGGMQRQRPRVAFRLDPGLRPGIEAPVMDATNGMTEEQKQYLQ